MIILFSFWRWVGIYRFRFTICHFQVTWKGSNIAHHLCGNGVVINDNVGCQYGDDVYDHQRRLTPVKPISGHCHDRSTNACYVVVVVVVVFVFVFPGSRVIAIDGCSRWYAADDDGLARATDWRDGDWTHSASAHVFITQSNATSSRSPSFGASAHPWHPPGPFSTTRRGLFVAQHVDERRSRSFRSPGRRRSGRECRR